MEDKLKELEKRIGYKFQDFSLLKHALMHSSYTNEKHLPKYQCNERLEFLGDAVLELVSSEFLFLENPKEPIIPRNVILFGISFSTSVPSAFVKAIHLIAFLVIALIFSINLSLSLSVNV